MTDMDTYEINALRRDAEIDRQADMERILADDALNYGHFHVGHSMPGYLPESDVTCHSDARDALRHFQSEVRYALDCVEDDGDFLAIDTERNSITESDVRNGSVSVAIEPYAYWIEHSMEDIMLCTGSDYEEFQGSDDYVVSPEYAEFSQDVINARDYS